jgi:hypothetical protein
MTEFAGTFVVAEFATACSEIDLRGVIFECSLMSALDIQGIGPCQY